MRSPGVRWPGRQNGRIRKIFVACPAARRDFSLPALRRLCLRGKSKKDICRRGAQPSGPGSSNKRIRSWLRTIYPYSLECHPTNLRREKELVVCRFRSRRKTCGGDSVFAADRLPEWHRAHGLADRHAGKAPLVAEPPHRRVAADQTACLSCTRRGGCAARLPLSSNAWSMLSNRPLISNSRTQEYFQHRSRVTPTASSADLPGR
jgi:hypothetical protein